ncbi:hypothetical protein [Pseudarthrobacter sp. TAF60_1]|uniref:hypothetical protein n=1 Tax=Pseudarthrobacter sp. TAF60_1 TaxID=3233071 RepID=UPI003F9C3BCF
MGSCGAKLPGQGGVSNVEVRGNFVNERQVLESRLDFFLGKSMPVQARSENVLEIFVYLSRVVHSPGCSYLVEETAVLQSECAHGDRAWLILLQDPKSRGCVLNCSTNQGVRGKYVLRAGVDDHHSEGVEVVYSG